VVENRNQKETRKRNAVGGKERYSRKEPVAFHLNRSPLTSLPVSKWLEVGAGDFSEDGLVGIGLKSPER
jgi:hypothetical protein